MKILSFFLHLYLLISIQCQAFIPRHQSSQAGVAASFPENEKESVPKIRPQSHNYIDDHGKPYSKDKVYFGYELPENKAGWITTGGSSETRVHDVTLADHGIDSTKRYRSINPVTGKPRKQISSCGGSPPRLLIPDDSECCVNLAIQPGTVKCRTYRLDNAAATAAISAPELLHPRDTRHLPNQNSASTSVKNYPLPSDYALRTFDEVLSQMLTNTRIRCVYIWTPCLWIVLALPPPLLTMPFLEGEFGKSAVVAQLPDIARDHKFHDEKQHDYEDVP